jgi:hypothetical protein
VSEGTDSLVGRKNGYSCQSCPARFVTIDVDEGVTPFMVSHAKFELGTLCTGMCHSHFYKIPQDLEPTHEWYLLDMPTARKRYRREPAMVDHIERGGLLLRARPGAPRTVRVDGPTQPQRRNDACACLSGKKWKRCHGSPTPPAPRPAPGGEHAG